MVLHPEELFQLNALGKLLLYFSVPGPHSPPLPLALMLWQQKP